MHRDLDPFVASKANMEILRLWDSHLSRRRESASSTNLCKENDPFPGLVKWLDAVFSGRPFWLVNENVSTCTVQTTFLPETSDDELHTFFTPQSSIVNLFNVSRTAEAQV